MEWRGDKVRKILVTLLLVGVAFFALTGRAKAYTCGSVCSAGNNPCSSNQDCNEVVMGYNKDGSKNCDAQCKAKSSGGGGGGGTQGGGGSSGNQGGGSSSGNAGGGGGGGGGSSSACTAGSAPGCSSVGQIIELGGSCMKCYRSSGTLCYRDFTSCPAGVVPQISMTPKPVVVQPGAGGGGGGGAQGGQVVAGGGGSGGTVCAAGSASTCVGVAFYDEKGGYVCFPNGVNSQGQTVCGRDLAANVAKKVDPKTGKPIGGYVVPAEKIDATNGGCASVVHCGCPNGMQMLCLSSYQMLAGDKAADYCARVVCSGVGENGKVCTPGQTKEGSCQNATGLICNADGKGWTRYNSHSCGATHSIVYCEGGTTKKSDGASYGCEAGKAFPNESACLAAHPECNGSVYGCAGCTASVVPVGQAITADELAKMRADLVKRCSDPKLQPEDKAACDKGIDAELDFRVAVIQDPAKALANEKAKCMGYPVGSTARASCEATAEKHVASVPKDKAEAMCDGSRLFTGCGTGAQSKYNCYKTCKDGKTSSYCISEPGLSCGAWEATTKEVAVVQDVFLRFTSSETKVTSPEPTPQPTPTPQAVCNQACGTNGAYCVGSNLACIDGVCRSTVCSVSEQNDQCVCPTPKPAPICVDIYASKTDIKLNDQVTFTCADVPNAERYEFRYTYLTKNQGTAGAIMQTLAPSSTTSRTTVPLTIDKIGRYIVQCRPCGANNVCQDWEPIDGENRPPRLEPATESTAQTSSTTESADQTNDMSATESQTSTTSAQTESTTETTTTESSSASTATDSAESQTSTSSAGTQ